MDISANKGTMPLFVRNKNAEYLNTKSFVSEVLKSSSASTTVKKFNIYSRDSLLLASDISFSNGEQMNDKLVFAEAFGPDGQNVHNPDTGTGGFSAQWWRETASSSEKVEVCFGINSEEALPGVTPNATNVALFDASYSPLLIEPVDGPQLPVDLETEQNVVALLNRVLFDLSGHTHEVLRDISGMTFDDSSGKSKYLASHIHSKTTITGVTPQKPSSGGDNAGPRVAKVPAAAFIKHVGTTDASSVQSQSWIGKAKTSGAGFDASVCDYLLSAKTAMTLFKPEMVGNYDKWRLGQPRLMTNNDFSFNDVSNAPTDGSPNDRESIGGGLNPSSAGEFYTNYDGYKTAITSWAPYNAHDISRRQVKIVDSGKSMVDLLYQPVKVELSKLTYSSSNTLHKIQNYLSEQSNDQIRPNFIIPLNISDEDVCKNKWTLQTSKNTQYSLMGNGVDSVDSSLVTGLLVKCKAERDDSGLGSSNDVSILNNVGIQSSEARAAPVIMRFVDVNMQKAINNILAINNFRSGHFTDNGTVDTSVNPVESYVSNLRKIQRHKLIEIYGQILEAQLCDYYDGSVFNRKFKVVDASGNSTSNPAVVTGADANASLGDSDKGANDLSLVLVNNTLATNLIRSDYDNTINPYEFNNEYRLLDLYAPKPLADVNNQDERDKVNSIYGMRIDRTNGADGNDEDVNISGGTGSGGSKITVKDVCANVLLVKNKPDVVGNTFGNLEDFSHALHGDIRGLVLREMNILNRTLYNESYKFSRDAQDYDASLGAILENIVPPIQEVSEQVRLLKTPVPLNMKGSRPLDQQFVKDNVYSTDTDGVQGWSCGGKYDAGTPQKTPQGARHVPFGEAAVKNPNTNIPELSGNDHTKNNKAQPTEPFMDKELSLDVDAVGGNPEFPIRRGGRISSPPEVSIGMHLTYCLQYYK